MNPNKLCKNKEKKLNELTSKSSQLFPVYTQFTVSLLLRKNQKRISELLIRAKKDNRRTIGDLLQVTPLTTKKEVELGMMFLQKREKQNYAYRFSHRKLLSRKSMITNCMVNLEHNSNTSYNLDKHFEYL